jgi:transposase
MVSEPDRVEVDQVSQCRHCQASPDQVAVESMEKRLVFDIPPVKTEVTEYQADKNVANNLERAQRRTFSQGLRKQWGMGRNSRR